MFSRSPGKQVVRVMRVLFPMFCQCRKNSQQCLELAKENLAKAQQRQKKWYDENARERQIEPGSQVLILLPTETSKLLA